MNPTFYSATPARRRAALQRFLWLGATWLLSLAAVSAADTMTAQDWMQWRGPLGSGVAPAADPPVTWSEDKGVRWKVKIPGEGTSTPIILGNRIFVQTAIPTGTKVEAAPESTAAPATVSTNAGAQGEPRREGRGRGMRAPQPTEVYQFVLLCLDRQTGKELWRRTAREEVPHEPRHRSEGSYASASPVTDGQHVFAYFGSRGLYCYDLEGQLKWSQDLGNMRIAMSFGEGSSPVLYQNLVIVNWDHEDGSFIVALDKATGKTVWKNPRDERTSWSTPLFIEHEGKPQVVVTATGKIRSYEPATGKLLWECGGLTRNVIPSPVTADGLLFAISGYQGNALLAIRLGQSGDLTGTDAIAWSYKKNTPYVPSPLLYQGRLYFFSGNNGVLSCLEAKSGKVLIDAEKIEALQGVYASPVAANGRVYLVGRNGATVVIKPSDSLEVVATNRLDEKFDASPAIAGTDLLLRGKEHLYCLAEPPSRTPDVIFVPTPQEVVDKMLEMAEIKPGEVVYDLGCGDGRIVVTAAKKYGVKGYGFDIDPNRIRESLANVASNKVEHLVTIRQADIFTLDLREANVVTLYLLPELNVKLMPQLEKLKPGSRILSHDFDMRGAKPVQVHSMSTDPNRSNETGYYGTEHSIFKWVVPWEKVSDGSNPGN
jgi:outer membrane protein assembly factor BamB